jgi:two-component system phosphate regulon sensor histidine kinase PhoR
MNKTFRWRLTRNFVVITVIFLTLSLVSSYFIFKDFYMKEIEGNITDQTILAADLLTGTYMQEDTAYLQRLSDKISSESGVRVTIVDSNNGNVLADSEFDSSFLEPHDARPEISKAIGGQIASDIRFSDTARINMLYVAVPFKNDTLSGVIRLAKPIDEIKKVLLKILSILLLTVVLTALAAFAVSAVAANRLSRPLSDISEAVKDIAQGNFKRRIYKQSDQEFEQLSAAVNNMAEYLERYLNEISEVKSQLEAVLDNTVNGILMLDYEGRIKYVNPAARELLFSHKDPIGKKHIEAISNYELLEIIDGIKNHSHSIKTNIILHSHGSRIIEINAQAISTTRGEQNDSILVVLNDITEIKHLEQVRKDFIANVTHELKTPIASISGFAETMLTEKVDTQEEFREFSQIIYNEAKRLTDLINELFELSRLESSKRLINLQPADINSIIEATVKLVEKKPEVKDYQIVFNKPGNPVWIKTDADSVVQIMINLLDNAVKYSEPESEIKITLDETPSEIVVSVIDKGEGISEKECSRIFERFYRTDKARSRKTGGTGLGLAIVKHLAENLGGRVGVNSKPGEGSSFFFSLPKG